MLEYTHAIRICVGRWDSHRRGGDGRRGLDRLTMSRGIPMTGIATAQALHNDNVAGTPRNGQRGENGGSYPAAWWW